MACSHPSILAVCGLLCGTNFLTPTSNILGTLLTLANGATGSGLVSVTAPALISCVQKSIFTQVTLSDGPVWARKKKKTILFYISLAGCLLISARIIINLKIKTVMSVKTLELSVCQQQLYAWILG